MRAVEGTSEWLRISPTSAAQLDTPSDHPRGYEPTLLDGGPALFATLAQLGVPSNMFGRINVRLTHGYPPLVELETTHGLVPAEPVVANLVCRWYVAAMIRAKQQR